MRGVPILIVLMVSTVAASAPARTFRPGDLSFATSAAALKLTAHQLVARFGPPNRVEFVEDEAVMQNLTWLMAGCTVTYESLVGEVSKAQRRAAPKALDGEIESLTVGIGPGCRASFAGTALAGVTVTPASRFGPLAARLKGEYRADCIEPCDLRTPKWAVEYIREDRGGAWVPAVILTNNGRSPKVAAGLAAWRAALRRKGEFDQFDTLATCPKAPQQAVIARAMADQPIHSVTIGTDPNASHDANC